VTSCCQALVLVVLFLFPSLPTFQKVQSKEKCLAVEGNLFSIHILLSLLLVGLKRLICNKAQKCYHSYINMLPTYGHNCVCKI
jgi:hypothetical protein